MLLSVIIPVYNGGKTIISAIRSTGAYLNNQIEVIVVNNGSTDNTETLVKKEGESNKNIIYTESEKGVSNARNKGIEIAKGDWITFLDADDFLLDLNNELMDLLQNIEEGLIVGNYLVGKSTIDLYSMTKNKKNNSSIVNQMLKNPTKYMTVWGKFYRNDLIKKENIRFDNQLKYSEDSEFLIRYILLCKQVRFININVYNYTLSKNSTVRSYNPQLIYEYEKAIFQIKKDLNKYPEYENSFKIFILMQFNLMMVHNVFIKNNKESIAKLKELCKKDYMNNALNIVKLKDIFTPRLLPLLLCKYHFYVFAAGIYKLRVLQNNRNTN